MRALLLIAVALSLAGCAEFGKRLDAYADAYCAEHGCDDSSAATIERVTRNTRQAEIHRNMDVLVEQARKDAGK